MAPKTKTQQASHVKAGRVKLHEISIAEDSSWRDLAPDHVESLKAVVLNGDYGSTTLAKPSLVLDQTGNEMISAIDGCYILNNGKQFIAALQALQPEYEKASEEVEKVLAAKAGAEGANGQNTEAACPPEGQEDLWPCWLVPDLRTAYKEGLIVDYVRYPSDDRLTHIAIQCLAHEQEQNLYRVSCIGDKVQVMTKAYNKVKDWTKAKKALLEVLGDTKSSTVYRWVVLSRDLDSQVLAWIKANWPTLGQAFIVGNKYVIGRGDDARVRLSPGYVNVCLQLLQTYVDTPGKKASAEVFMNEFCAPLRQLEIWEKQQIKVFGATASNFVAFNRLIRTFS